MTSVYATRREEYKEIGQLNYEGYAASLGWQLPTGGLLPPWAQLDPRNQDAFREGARRVMQHGWTEP